MIEKMLNAIESLKSNILGSNRLMKSNLTLDFHCSYCTLSIRMVVFFPHALLDDSKLKTVQCNWPIEL